ncbi:hypothetical protein GM160_05585 [Guyparkeria halophila]|uniref:Large polyvalent protein associated domain-containing protein n=1 Tax=Guyparkeria halophila TaxID=47960 RepID=A0A6I6CYD6_9GAMM|nr:LPD38 domain-containing protein [Guyparkeria halophila]QGT78410.1 hypothetical protein GM160_05585 [Guyparkeria halophila]
MAEQYIQPREFLRRVKEKRPDLDDEYILQSWDEHVKPLAGQADKEGEGTSLFGMSDEQRDHVARGGYLTDRADEMREHDEGWAGDRRADLKVGAGGLVEGIGTLLSRQLGGMDNTLRAKGQAMQDAGEREVGDEYGSDLERRKARVDSADGELAKALAWGAETFIDADLAAGMVTREIPSLAVGGVTGFGAKKLAQTGARKIGASDDAARKVGNKVGVGTAVGVESAESGALTKSETFDELTDLPPEEFIDAAKPRVRDQYEALRNGGMSEREAVEQIADELSNVAGLRAAGFTALMQALPASRSIERVITASMKREAGGLAGAAKGGAKAAGAEGATGAADEAYQTAIGNLAVQQVDETQSLAEGTGVAAAQGGTFGAGMGGPAGALEGAAGTQGATPPVENEEQAADPDEYVVDAEDGAIKKVEEADRPAVVGNPDAPRVTVEGLGERELVSDALGDRAIVRDATGRRDVVEIVPTADGPTYRRMGDDDSTDAEVNQRAAEIVAEADPSPERGGAIVPPDVWDQAQAQARAEIDAARQPVGRRARAAEQINEVRQSGPLGRSSAPTMATNLNRQIELEEAVSRARGSQPVSLSIDSDPAARQRAESDGVAGARWNASTPRAQSQTRISRTAKTPKTHVSDVSAVAETAHSRSRQRTEQVIRRSDGRPFPSLDAARRAARAQRVARTHVPESVGSEGYVLNPAGQENGVADLGRDQVEPGRQTADFPDGAQPAAASGSRQMAGESGTSAGGAQSSGRQATQRAQAAIDSPPETRQPGAPEAAPTQSREPQPGTLRDSGMVGEDGPRLPGRKLKPIRRRDGQPFKTLAAARRAATNHAARDTHEVREVNDGGYELVPLGRVRPVVAEQDMQPGATIDDQTRDTSRGVDRETDEPGTQAGDPDETRAAGGSSGDGGGVRFSRSAPEGEPEPTRNHGITRIRGKADKVIDGFLYHVVDRFKDLADFQKAAGKVPETADAMMAQENFSGRARKRLDDLDDFHVRPLLDAINRGGFTMEQVGEYLHARHAQEANRVLAERNPDRGDNSALSGMTDMEARAILAEHADNAAMQEIGERVDRMNAERLENMVNDGLMSPEQADSWRSMYSHYVPLHRDAMKGPDGEIADAPLPRRGQGFHIEGRESKVRAGSTKPVEHGLVIPHLVAQFEASAVRGEKNLVGQALLELASNHPDPNVWEIEKPYRVASRKPDGTIRYRADNRTRDNELMVKVGGKGVRISFNEKNPHAVRLVREMRNLSQRDMPKLMRYLHSVMRYLSMVNTSLNPEFVLTNFARDLQTAAYNLGDTELEKVAMQVVRDGVKHGVRGMWRNLKGHRDTEWARWADEFERAGGMVGWMDVYENIEDRANAINRELDMVGGKHVARRTGRKVMDLVSDANSAIENAVRLSAYVHARKRGISEARAANLAKNLTVNFNRRGASGQTLNTFYLFFNASVQGTARMFSAIHKSRKVRAMVGATVVAAAILDIVNRAISEEDEDGLTFYDKLPDHVRDRNLVIFYGGGETDYVTIPLPWGYNVFHVVGQTMGRAIDHHAGDGIPTYSIADEAARLAGSTMEAFNPVASSSPLLTLSPTVLDPAVTVAVAADVKLTP